MITLKNHLDKDFKQNNFYSFCLIMSSLATIGAVSEIYYMLNQEMANRAKYIKHPDGTIEISGDEEKIANLIDKEK
jgi:hypothetical protein